MRAVFEKVKVGPERSFLAVEHAAKRFDSMWHFHPEIELTLIVQGRGRRVVGDSIESFVSGDLVLLGSDVPHFWQDTGPQQGGVRAIVVQFTPDFLGQTVWGLPEFAAVRRLLDRALRGWAFPATTGQALAEPLRLLCAPSGLAALATLLHILDTLSRERGGRALATVGYAPILDRQAVTRLARVYRYASAHVAEPMTLADLAREAAMTPAAFSRYFKRATGRNPSDFLNDPRVEHAARWLRESTHTVADISGRVGFSTLSSFNRRFKERMHLTPRAYRAAFSGR